MLFAIYNFMQVMASAGCDTLSAVFKVSCRLCRKHYMSYPDRSANTMPRTNMKPLTGVFLLRSGERPCIRLHGEGTEIKL